MVVLVAVGIGTAFGIEPAIGRHFDIDADSDPDTDSDPGISRYQLYFRDRPLERSSLLLASGFLRKPFFIQCRQCRWTAPAAWCG